MLFVVITFNSGSDGPAGIGLVGIGLMILAILINTPLQAVLLGRGHAPPGQRSGSFVRHLPFAGQVAVWTVIVAIVLPIVLALAAILGV